MKEKERIFINKWIPIHVDFDGKNFQPLHNRDMLHFIKILFIFRFHSKGGKKKCYSLTH